MKPFKMIWWEQRWRSGESTRLPPMWPVFDSWSHRHMWVEFVVGSLLAPRGFFPVFPLQKELHCQIPIRSGMHRHVLDELLGALKVYVDKQTNY